MKKLSLSFIAVLALFACSYFTEEKEVTFLDHTHTQPTDESHAHTNHDHAGMEPIEWDATGIPSVTLTVHEDPKAGWNIHADVENFRFAPESASLEHVPGEGHAHLYIDGEKINRLYGEWYHIPSLTLGEHEIVVNLNSNDHFPFTLNGEKLHDSATVVVDLE